MTTATELATIVDLERQPGRCELIDGEIITISPTGYEHADIEGQIGFLLRGHCQTTGQGRVLVGDPGFILDEYNVRAPDVAVIDLEQRRQVPVRGFMPFVPRLAVEVVSPGDGWSEVKAKVALWIRHGVRLVWVVDPQTRTVEVHAPDRQTVVLGESDRIDGATVLPEFSCVVAEFFA